MAENPYTTYAELRPSKKIVVNLLEGKEFNSVLEVGCQWGENLIAIREKFPDKKIVGVDADWDGIVQEAKTITGLDIRKGSVFSLEFQDKEFDVVFTNALFCMLQPEQIETGLKEIIRVAKKYIILIELKTEEFIGIVKGGRTGADWVSLLGKYGLEATTKKIPSKVWGANPWVDNGYIYEVKL